MLEPAFVQVIDQLSSKLKESQPRVKDSARKVFLVHGEERPAQAGVDRTTGRAWDGQHYLSRFAYQRWDITTRPPKN